MNSKSTIVDLRPDHLATVNAILFAEVPDYEVWAFGSRAKWTAKDSSDLDLALASKEPVPAKRLRRLQRAFEESYLPLKVDVVDLSKVSPEFYALIEEQHIVLHKPDTDGEAKHPTKREWRSLPLEECVETIIDYRGKTPKKVAQGIPLITAKIIKHGRIETPDEFVPPDDYEDWMRRGIPQAGDVLLTTEAPLGEVAQLDDRKVALAQRVVALRGKKGLLDNDFLKYLLQSRQVQDQLKSRASGTTVQGIKQSELRKINLTLPRLDEQRSIAQLLGSLDKKIELNWRMNETLEATAEALFKARLVDPPAGGLPAGWVEGDILQHATLLSGGTPKTDREDYWDGKILWVSAKDVSQCGETFLVNTERTITQRGLEESTTQVMPCLSTVVVARGATTGRMVILGRAMAMNQTCYALVSTIGTPFTLHCLLRREIDNLVRIAHGSVFDTITTSTFASFQVVMPPIQLLNVFEETMAPLFDRILTNTEESRTLAALRDALLPKLLSGELRVKSCEI